MTPGGESVLRVKAFCVVGPHTERMWRESRAKSLAIMIAWHRRSLGYRGEAHVRRVILEDIVPDCGWPKLKWLKPRIRAEQSRIAASLADFGRVA